MLLYIKLIIVLERCKYIRQHPVDSATLIIAALMPWNSEPFMCSVLVSYNAAAVITEDKTAFLTYETKIFTAHCSLIKICCPFLVKSVTIYMVFTKVPEVDLAGGGSGAFPFLLIRTV